MDAQSVAFAKAVSSTSADATGSTGEIKLPPLPPPPDSPEPDQLSPASAAPVEKAIKDDEAQHIYMCIYIYNLEYFPKFNRIFRKACRGLRMNTLIF